MLGGRTAPEHGEVAGLEVEAPPRAGHKVDVHAGVGKGGGLDHQLLRLHHPIEVPPHADGDGAGQEAGDEVHHRHDVRVHVHGAGEPVVAGQHHHAALGQPQREENLARRPQPHLDVRQLPPSALPGQEEEGEALHGSGEPEGPDQQHQQEEVGQGGRHVDHLAPPPPPRARGSPAYRTPGLRCCDTAFTDNQEKEFK